MSESTGARHYVLFPDVKNAQSLYALMKAAGVRCTNLADRKSVV